MFLELKDKIAKSTNWLVNNAYRYIDSQTNIKVFVLTYSMYIYEVHILMISMIS